MRMMPELRIRT